MGHKLLAPKLGTEMENGNGISVQSIRIMIVRNW